MKEDDDLEKIRRALKRKVEQHLRKEFELIVRELLLQPERGDERDDDP